MMKFCSKNIFADAFTGAIFALEGIKDACIILNGPTGCKFYHSTISDQQYMRSLSLDALPIQEEFYFGQPRVPATYLDGHDYVYGVGEKLSNILHLVKQQDFQLIAIVNSPGAALIGDDLEKFLQQEIQHIPCFALENTGFSGSFGTGYQNGIIKALDTIPLKPRKIRKKSVNLLGLCIYQKYYDTNGQELKRLLSLCDIEVISTPGILDDCATLSACTEAEYNVVVYPEFGNLIAQRLQETHQIPFLLLEEGPPIGFEATETFIKQICTALQANPQLALREIEKARAKSYLYLSRFSSLLGLPKGALFSIQAETSTAYVLTKWLSSYLGMIPAAINLTDNQDSYFSYKLTAFLQNIGYESVLQNPINQTPTQIAFADGNTIAQLRLQGMFISGIEIVLPSLGYLDIMEKSLFGEKGSLFLLEQIINGLRYVKA